MGVNDIEYILITHHGVELLMVTVTMLSARENIEPDGQVQQCDDDDGYENGDGRHGRDGWVHRILHIVEKLHGNGVEYRRRVEHGQFHIDPRSNETQDGPGDHAGL